MGDEHGDAEGGRSIHDASRTAKSTAVTRPMRTAKPPRATAMMALSETLAAQDSADGGEHRLTSDEGDGDGGRRGAVARPR